jgi:preprotein translocase subunit SecA
MLKRDKIPHTVLNAKFHMQEAEIISRAGMRGAVTISTNMAGRGTDIKLGEGVADLGGLFVLGTERHESRRIDRQLRGRCARQGDPGRSRFYISFEDDLMRNFGAADRMTKIMETFGMKEGEELEHPWLNRSVETAQKRVEQRNSLMRRRTLEFDDVMNQQREVIYGYRNEVMDAENPRVLIHEVINEVVPKKVSAFLTTESSDSEPDVAGLLQWVNSTFPVGLTKEKCAFESREMEENGEWLAKTLVEAYDRKAAIEDAAARSGLEKYVILNAVDRLWQEHLYAMDGLREAVYLRAYGQKDPLTEYKTEAYAMFVELMESIKNEVLNNLFRSTTNLQAFEQLLASMPRHLMQKDLLGSDGHLGANEGEIDSTQTTPQPQSVFEQAMQQKPVQRVQKTAGRNDPCPCGSGKKFKSCCGRTA